jgi:predicted tellurium resistance membrane protein TerC
MEWMANPEAWIALGTLTALEIVLGIDNIIFITILVGRVNEAERGRARTIGLALAMITRILLLLSLSWVMTLTEPLFSALGNDISGRDLILLIGGLFLLAKSTHEIHAQMEDDHAAKSGQKKHASFLSVVSQIAIIDIVFSLDSVITAVGLAKDIEVMIIAVVLSVIVMILAAKSIGDFVDEHPTIKVLALSFLLLVGTSLIGEGLDFHIPKGYIYFAMAFSIGVEFVNLKIRKKKDASHGIK